jgi:hypothetical protein
MISDGAAEQLGGISDPAEDVGCRRGDHPLRLIRERDLGRKRAKASEGERE